MHSEHPLADNLLGRLRSYTPRVGRDPLEDFCTEALAYCLRTHQGFREWFLRRIDSNLVRQDEPMPRIHTQLTFRRVDGNEEEPAQASGGRFDLVIETSQILVVVEVKVWSNIADNQLAKYRRELNEGMRFSEHRDRGAQMILTTLTPRVNRLVDYAGMGVDVRIRWSEIQAFLEKIPRQEMDVGTSICRQFAELLREKGMAPMYIHTINTNEPMKTLDALELRDQMETILKAYQGEKRMAALLKNDIDTQRDPDAFWIFLNGRTKFPETAGFKIDLHNDGRVGLALFVEGMVHGEIAEARLKEILMANLMERHIPSALIEYNPEHGATWMRFGHQVGEDLDGNADAIRDWLVDATFDMVKLGGLLTGTSTLPPSRQD